MSRFSLPAAPRRARHPYRISRLPSPVAGGHSPALASPSSSVIRPSSALHPRDLLRLQRAYGNRAVQRLLDHDRPTLPAPTGGQPLPKAVAGKLQRAFDADLSGVRVSESPAVASLGARAVTQGSHIAFAPGELRPNTAAGQQLLGHELTHVLQQRAGGPTALNPQPLLPPEQVEKGGQTGRTGPQSASSRAEESRLTNPLGPEAPPSLAGKGAGGLGRPQLREVVPRKRLPVLRVRPQEHQVRMPLPPRPVHRVPRHHVGDDRQPRLIAPVWPGPVER